MVRAIDRSSLEWLVKEAEQDFATAHLSEEREILRYREMGRKIEADNAGVLESLGLRPSELKQQEGEDARGSLERLKDSKERFDKSANDDLGRSREYVIIDGGSGGQTEPEDFYFAYPYRSSSFTTEDPDDGSADAKANTNDHHHLLYARASAAGAGSGFSDINLARAEGRFFFAFMPPRSDRARVRGPIYPKGWYRIEAWDRGFYTKKFAEIQLKASVRIGQGEAWGPWKSQTIIRRYGSYCENESTFAQAIGSTPILYSDPYQVIGGTPMNAEVAIQLYSRASGSGAVAEINAWGEDYPGGYWIQIGGFHAEYV